MSVMVNMCICIYVCIICDTIMGGWWWLFGAAAEVVTGEMGRIGVELLSPPVIIFFIVVMIILY